MSLIEFDTVSKSFGRVQALKETSLAIEVNEFFALLGPSGCGKTTLLRILAGFETPTTGRVVIDGTDITGLPPNKRPVNMVFQSYAVFPHMSVADNVAYGLTVTGTPKAETSKAVAEALDRVGLADFGARRPDQLSGGQRQRVALARALVKRPKVMLLDEPLSALDAKLREAMQLELSRLQLDVGITFVMVTHDQDEALSMADRIAVMDAGAIRQIGDPADIYERPANRFVADFIGRVNLMEGEVSGAHEKGVTVNTVFGTAHVDHDARAAGKVTLAIRPEKIRAGPEAASLPLATTGRIAEWAYYGDTSLIIVETAEGERLSVVLANETRDRAETMEIGGDIQLGWSPADMLLLPE